MKRRTKMTWALGRRRSSRPRRAAVLVGVLVALFVIMLLVGTITKSLVRSHRRSEVFERSLQSMLLAEAGVQRAISQLAADPTYRGEQWAVPKQSIAQVWPAEVVIHVEPVAKRPGAERPSAEEARSDAVKLLRIIVDSYYPFEPHLRVVHHREQIISIDTTGETQ